jgi:hypothetical protein
VAVDGAGPADTHTEHPGQADHGERIQHTHPGISRVNHSFLPQFIGVGIDRAA